MEIVNKLSELSLSVVNWTVTVNSTANRQPTCNWNSYK